MQQGGVVEARVFTKIWLALFGVYPWTGVPSLPPEIVYFPLWMPFNLYDFACWARGTVAPLTIVVSQRPGARDSAMTSSEIVVPGSERETDAREGLAALAALSLDEAAQAVRTAADASRWRDERAAAHRELDRRAPGSRRKLGRHSAAVGLFADRARPDGIRRSIIR